MCILGALPVFIATLLEYRIVGKKSRFFASGLGGTSYMAYGIKAVAGGSGTLLHELDITIMWAATDNHENVSWDQAL
jgi:hypothetical protein